MSDNPGRQAGQRLKRAIHVARSQSPYTSDMAMAIAAKVHYDTLMNWFSGRTVPRPSAIKQVADVLGIPYADLMAAYEDRAPAAVPLEQAVAELIVEIRASVIDERRARADLMRTIAAALAATVSVPSTLSRDG
jgi:hypothetical protein